MFPFQWHPSTLWKSVCNNSPAHFQKENVSTITMDWWTSSARRVKSENRANGIKDLEISVEWLMQWLKSRGTRGYDHCGVGWRRRWWWRCRRLCSILRLMIICRFGWRRSEFGHLDVPTDFGLVENRKIWWKLTLFVLIFPKIFDFFHIYEAPAWITGQIMQFFEFFPGKVKSFRKSEKCSHFR